MKKHEIKKSGYHHVHIIHTVQCEIGYVVMGKVFLLSLNEFHSIIREREGWEEAVVDGKLF